MRRCRQFWSNRRDNIRDTNSRHEQIQAPDHRGTSTDDTKETSRKDTHHRDVKIDANVRLPFYNFVWHEMKFNPRAIILRFRINASPPTPPALPPLPNPFC